VFGSRGGRRAWGEELRRRRRSRSRAGQGIGGSPAGEDRERTEGETTFQEKNKFEAKVLASDMQRWNFPWVLQKGAMRSSGFPTRYLRCRSPPRDAPEGAAAGKRIQKAIPPMFRMDRAGGAGGVSV
jgi:hypothetical protein